MGTFSSPITVSDLQGRQSVTLEAQVDTGATYLVLPRDILERLGVRASEQMAFRLADGRRESFPIGQVQIQLDGRRRVVVCVFAPLGATPLLGAFPLEAFGLAADPVNKRLVPVEGLLLATS